ncbi:MAG TPA: hypothetical protein VEU50_29885 [Archangium sp.]|nr:hypothetical protein [Archangium sp.]HYO56999.1 hypothetical protein [Archangium sp.]
MKRITAQNLAVGLGLMALALVVHAAPAPTTVAPSSEKDTSQIAGEKRVTALVVTVFTPNIEDGGTDSSVFLEIGGSASSWMTTGTTSSEGKPILSALRQTSRFARSETLACSSTAPMAGGGLAGSP